MKIKDLEGEVDNLSRLAEKYQTCEAHVAYGLNCKMPEGHNGPHDVIFDPTLSYRPKLTIVK